MSEQELPDDLTDEEFAKVAQNVSSAVYQLLDTITRIHQVQFADRESAAFNSAPLISGILDGLIRWSMDPDDPGDDPILRAELIRVIDEQMGETRFGIMTRRVGSVGNGSA